MINVKKLKCKTANKKYFPMEKVRRTSRWKPPRVGRGRRPGRGGPRVKTCAPGPRPSLLEKRWLPKRSMGRHLEAFFGMHLLRRGCAI